MAIVCPGPGWRRRRSAGPLCLCARPAHRMEHGGRRGIGRSTGPACAGPSSTVLQCPSHQACSRESTAIKSGGTSCCPRPEPRGWVRPWRVVPAGVVHRSGWSRARPMDPVVGSVWFIGSAGGSLEWNGFFIVFRDRAVELAMRLLYTARSSGAGWSSPVARRAHNPKVTGSNPVPATISSDLSSERLDAIKMACHPGT